MRAINGLYMNGGNAETSYANNSSLQQEAIIMTKPIREKAISDLCTKLSPKTVCVNIADLGCSSGPNTLLVTSEIAQSIYNSRLKLLGQEPHEIQVFLNDLPGNDFNNLFKLLAQFQDYLTTTKEEKWKACFQHCYFTGVPGTFYHRLFPTETLHFVHVSYSNHWLSQVPEGVGKSNKRNICVTNTSPTSVIEAYYKQFDKDFSMFLKHRSLELVFDGHMVFTTLGRKGQDSGENGFLVYELLAEALSDMVFEGLIEEEKLHSFNTPNYMPTPKEIASIVREEGSFIIDHLQTFEIHWNAHKNGSLSYSEDDDVPINEVGFSVMKAIRSVLEPLLLDHFQHQGILDEMFRRYQEKITNCMTCETEKAAYFNIVVSMKKKTN